MLKMLYRRVKRFLDIVISLFLLILLSPLLLIISFLIKIEDGGSIFAEKPLRIGLGGKEFFMYKFRTMIPNAYNEIHNNSSNADIKKEMIKNSMKIPLSERKMYTKIGIFLRSCDLDELPQLMNVLKGEMSLVGPRPSYQLELDEHYKKYPMDKKLLERILAIRPGITGVWQVSGRNSIPLHARFLMDSEYCQYYNLFIDTKILLLTPYVVLTRKGVYE